jgi:hypothetical protein
MSGVALKGVSGLTLFCALALAVSQTILNSTLQEVTRYSAAALNLIANAVSGVNKVEAAQIPQSDRSEVQNELKRISFAISTLRSAQMPLVFDLSEYVDKVRADQLDDSARKREWSNIVESIDQVSRTVKTTLDVVETSRWLKIALDEEDRLTLREVLLSRASLLSKLGSLPAPRSTDEINELEQLNKFYRQLVRSLGDLNAALVRATERISTG